MQINKIKYFRASSEAPRLKFSEKFTFSKFNQAKKD